MGEYLIHIQARLWDKDKISEVMFSSYKFSVIVDENTNLRRQYQEKSLQKDVSLDRPTNYYLVFDKFKCHRFVDYVEY